MEEDNTSPRSPQTAPLDNLDALNSAVASQRQSTPSVTLWVFLHSEEAQKSWGFVESSMEELTLKGIGQLAVDAPLPKPAPLLSEALFDECVEPLITDPHDIASSSRSQYWLPNVWKLFLNAVDDLLTWYVRSLRPPP
jgi:hypothetical protein